MEEDIIYTLDDRHEIYNRYVSQCGSCVYFKRDGYKCLAFPEGIPDELLAGERTHSEEYPGQTGETVYLKKD